MRLSDVKSPASREKRSRWSVVPSGEEPTDDILVSPCRLGLKGLQAGIFRLDRTTSSGIADQRHYVRASTVDSHNPQYGTGPYSLLPWETFAAALFR